MGNTFRMIAEGYVSKLKQEGRSEKAIAKIEWLLSFAYPMIGGKPIKEIGAPDILRALREVEARGRHESARRLWSTIGSVFRYAIATARAYAIPSAAVHAGPAIAAWVRDNVPTPLIVGPDSESAQWVKAVAHTAGAPWIVLEKHRHGDRDVEISAPDMRPWRGRTPVLVDNIISTAHTMIETTRGLRAAGATEIIVVGIHGLFAGQAYDELAAAGVQKIVTCNTVAHPSNAIDVTALLARAAAQLMRAQKGGGG